jgi:hypothetical protein
MAELQLTVTEKEREYLMGLLERALQDVRIEEHRTRTPLYREHVLQQENLIHELLNQLRQPPR